MSKRIYILSLICGAALLASCQQENGGGQQAGELTLAPTVRDRADVTQSRALNDPFFTEGGLIDVTIKTQKNRTLPGYEYAYGADRIFRGNPGFKFALNDDYITELTAVWPTQDIRNEGIVRDQRLLEDYKKSDWMTATATADGIMPTDAAVPLTFTRDNTMLEFELVGQNTKGINIKSLVIELEANNEAAAFWAYCGNTNGHAELILEAGVRIFSPDQYLIGRVTVDPGDPYTIIFPQTDLTLEAGTRYLVTLTPQGYYMAAYVFVGGFNDGEGGIGIPLDPPAEDASGNFVISTFRQLVTMSYLIRHYTDAQPSFNWPAMTYIIATGFTITPEQAAEYIPIPAGTVIQLDGTTTPITTVNDTEGNEVNLFEQ